MKHDFILNVNSTARATYGTSFIFKIECIITMYKYILTQRDVLYLSWLLAGVDGCKIQLFSTDAYLIIRMLQLDSPLKIPGEAAV